MESDLQHQHFHHLFSDQDQRKMNNSGLTRYQSAPSSYFSNLLECEEFFNRPTSPETERIFAKFLADSEQKFAAAQAPPPPPPPVVVKQDSPARNEEEIGQQSQIFASINQPPQQQNQQSNFGFFPSQSKPPLPDQSAMSGNRLAGIQRAPPMRSGGSTSNLLRHNSSPAGLFANLAVEMENGYAVMRGMGETNYSSSANRPPIAGGRMSSIAEMGTKNMGENASDNSGFDYPMGFLDDNVSSSGVSKRLADDDGTFSGLNQSETQNRESGIPAPKRLAHHLSLPAEMTAIEKFLQESVPCKIRAKRGFATHPRSIAERVRRTKISERMRKLQDLVPNMDKQTNTSDMLDLAVEYIKDLQRKVKTLAECRANCTCDIKPQP